MKRCLSCAEIVSEADDFCRNCGSSIFVPHPDQTEEVSADDELESTGSNATQKKKITDSYTWSHFLVGFVVLSIVQILAFIIGYQSNYLPDSISRSGAGQDIAFGILFGLSLLLSWIGVIGWKVEFRILYFIGFILLSYIPIVGQIVMAVFIGRGIFVLLERRKMKKEPSG